MLSEADQALIAAAVAKAESATSAEVACVVTEAVSDYREIPLAVAAAAALLVPPLAIVLGLRLEALAAPFAGWSAAHGTAAAGPVLTLYALLQVAVFAAVLLAAWLPAVRRALTPRGLRQRRVRRAAELHFAAARRHLPPGLPMVLIFASLAERQMEIVADEATHVRVGQTVWDDAVGQALATIRTAGTAAGLARAVEVCGAALADHLPDDGAPNAFPDRTLQV